MEGAKLWLRRFANRCPPVSSPAKRKATPAPGKCPPPPCPPAKCKPPPPGPAGTLKKPELRGMLIATFKTKAIGAALFTLAITLAYKIGVVNRRRNLYLATDAEYDEIDRGHYERMKLAGAWQSFTEDGSPNKTF